MGFFEKIIFKYFSKTPKVANLSQNATGIVKFLQPLQIWVLLKKQMGFSKKILDFFDIAKGSKIVIESHRNS